MVHHQNSASVTSNVNQDVQFQWKLSGLTDGLSFTLRFYYGKTERNVDKLLSGENNGKPKETIYLDDNSQAKVDGVSVDKVKASCEITIPTAICIFTISNAGYAFTGEYFFQYFHISRGYVQANSSVKLNIVGKLIRSELWSMVIRMPENV